MAWINSDDMYMPWAFAVVAEVFRQLPQVHWLTGMHGVWSGTRLVRVTSNMESGGPCCRLDYLRGNYRWIQQESTFWSRDLWLRAGGRLDDSCRLAVDGELWARFFDHERLHCLGTVVSGFRSHETNRSLLQLDDYTREMKQVVEKMLARATPQEREWVRRMSNASALRHRLGRLGWHLSPLLRRLCPSIPESHAIKSVNFCFKTKEWEVLGHPYRVF
jgi:hypothetical protein